MKTNTDFNDTKDFTPIYSDELIEAEVITGKDNQKFEDYDHSPLERVSFLTVMSDSVSPQKTFEALLNRFHEQRTISRNQLKNSYEKDLERYDMRIKNYETLIQNEKDKLKNYENTISLNKKDREKLKEDLLELEKEVQKYLEYIGKKRGTLVQDRIKQVKGELDELIKTLDEANNGRYAINERNFQNNKAVLEEESKLFKEMVSSYETDLDNIKDDINKLDKKGVTIPFSNFLIFTGFSVTGIAGWLFSIFSVDNDFNADGWLFFILQALYDFGDKMKATMPFIEGFKILILIAGVLILLFLVALIAYFCQFLLEKWGGSHESSHTIQLSGDLDNHIKFNKNITSGSFLGTWLHLMPFIFIIGIGYIILQSGLIDANGLRKLDASLSGQVAGSTIALLIGGLAFMYINNIIVPRFQKGNSKNIDADTPSLNTVLLLRKNIELLILLLIFVLTFVLMYLSNVKGAAALIGFVSCSLLSGFLIGIGYRYKGLFQIKNSIQHMLFQLKHAIKRNSGPVSIYLTLEENKKFSKKLLNLEEELLNLLIIKTKHIKGQWSTGEKKERQSQYLQNPQKKRYFAWVFRHKNEPFKIHSDSISPNYNLSSPNDKLLFPEETTIIKDLTDKITFKKDKIRFIDDQLNKDLNEKSDYQIDKKNQIKNLTQLMDACRKTYTDRMKQFLKDSNSHYEITVIREAKLRDGYDLAVWYLKYGKTTHKEIEI